MKAQVMAIVTLDFKAEVPEMKFKQVREDSAAMEATNEATVLKARVKAAKQAEQLAKEAFKGFDVVELIVQEVVVE